MKRRVDALDPAGAAVCACQRENKFGTNELMLEFEISIAYNI